MLTNRLALPEAIVQAVANDSYSPGKSDISVTGLLTPPFQRKLRREVEVVEDVSDRIWALLGQLMHSLLERAHQGEGQVETRLYMPIEGWVVSGQFDLYTDQTLWDYKLTSVWSRLGKPEWEWQLNFLRLLAAHNGMEVNALKIVTVYRDWTKSKTFDGDYPKSQVEVIDIPVWPLEVAQERMAERVRLHQQPNPDPCSDEDRWKVDDIYALKKEGRKAAVRLYTSREEANSAAKALGKGHSVEYRPGAYKRCESYCNVAHSCPAYNRDLF